MNVCFCFFWATYQPTVQALVEPICYSAISSQFLLCLVCCGYVVFLLSFPKWQPLSYLRPFEHGMLSARRSLFRVEFMVSSPKFFKSFKVPSLWGLLWPIFKIITNSCPFFDYIFISLHSSWQLLSFLNLCLFSYGSWRFFFILKTITLMS